MMKKIFLILFFCVNISSAFASVSEDKKEYMQRLERLKKMKKTIICLIDEHIHQLKRKKITLK